DFDEHGGHQQVLAGQLKVLLAYLFNVRKVLPRDFRHGDVQHIEILLAYQVQEQIQGTLESLKEYFEGVGRNVKVLRHGEQGFAVQTGQRHAIDNVGRGVFGWVH